LPSHDSHDKSYVQQHQLLIKYQYPTLAEYDAEECSQANYALFQGQYAGLDHDKEVGVMMTSKHHGS